MALTPGAKLAPYDVIAKLGAGGMGKVYRAADTRLDRAGVFVRPRAGAVE